LTGLAVAINGNVAMVDVFDSPRLYAKLERKLLASYVLAALERQPGSAAKAKAYDEKARALKKANVDSLLKPDASAAVAADNDSASQQAVQAYPKQAKSYVEAKSAGKVFVRKGKVVHGSYFDTDASKDDDTAQAK